MFLILTNSCKKDNNNTTPTVQIPVLTTSAVSSITQSTASCGGNITSDGGSTVTANGVCWSTGQAPTTANSKTTDGTGAGSFTSTITGLMANTTYYVRAYATNSAGTGYGSAMSLTTQQGNGSTITDIDGNVYHFVTIGTQVWMVENLKTTKYRDGTAIPNVTNNAAWAALTTGAYCNYNNDVNSSTTYGRLYNWHTVNDSRNIAPTGWHVPTDAEWTTLTNYLGGENIAGGKLKEINTTHWTTPNAGADNSSGFTGLPGGYRYNNGLFVSVGNLGYFWSATQYDATYAWERYLNYYGSNIVSFNLYKTYGFSVRCLRD